MAKVSFAPTAEADFGGLPAPVQARGVQIIENVLAEFPGSGASVVFEGEPLRMFPITPYPYIVVYESAGDSIWSSAFSTGR